MNLLRALALSVAFVATPAFAAEKPATKPATRPAASTQPVYTLQPTMKDIHYGPHAKQVLDFWKADSKTPTPVLFFIHGGGWTAGNRSSGVNPLIEPMLKNGISVVSIEYRFVSEATADNVVPPVKGPLSDAARALQFVRSKAAEWNLDKTKIAAAGGSAGACTSLWLAFHDDMADPKSEDPVARESTRLTYAAVTVPQTTLDPQQMKEWTPNSKYGAHAFGISASRESKTNNSFDAFLASREKILPWIAEYSPYALVTKDDPPVYMLFPTAPNLGHDEKDPTHTANFGLKLQEHCKEVGVPCELVYPGAPDVKHKTLVEALLAALKK